MKILPKRLLLTRAYPRENNKQIKQSYIQKLYIASQICKTYRVNNLNSTVNKGNKMNQSAATFPRNPYIYRERGKGERECVSDSPTLSIKGEKKKGRGFVATIAGIHFLNFDPSIQFLLFNLWKKLLTY